MGDIARNALFPFFLTRALLPKLRRAAGPVEVVFTGSLSSSLPCPRINPYGASKAFLRQLTRGLHSDERFRAARAANVSYSYMDVGSVATAGHKFAPSLATPAAADFAKHFVHFIGCGRAYIVPYWLHALQMVFMHAMPEVLTTPMIFQAMAEEVEAGKKD